MPSFSESTTRLFRNIRSLLRFSQIQMPELLQVSMLNKLWLRSCLNKRKLNKHFLERPSLMSRERTYSLDHCSNQLLQSRKKESGLQFPLFQIFLLLRERRVPLTTPYVNPLITKENLFKLHSLKHLNQDPLILSIQLIKSKPSLLNKKWNSRR
jgi:hypothetical protein